MYAFELKKQKPYIKISRNVKNDDIIIIWMLLQRLDYAVMLSAYW